MFVSPLTWLPCFSLYIEISCPIMDISVGKHVTCPLLCHSGENVDQETDTKDVTLTTAVSVSNNHPLSLTYWACDFSQNP